MCSCHSLHLAGDEELIHSPRASFLWILNTAVFRSVGDHRAPAMGFKPMVLVVLQSRCRGLEVSDVLGVWGARQPFGVVRIPCDLCLQGTCFRGLGKSLGVNG